VVNVNQLPTFSFTTASTTVNVPDGGTVLLGGIRRLQEARPELGVPMLNNIPYVNRLLRGRARAVRARALALRRARSVGVSAEARASSRPAGDRERRLAQALRGTDGKHDGAPRQERAVVA
jgi:type II secretory pathway component GspD/PulD (secretin)